LNEELRRLPAALQPTSFSIPHFSISSTMNGAAYRPRCKQLSISNQHSLRVM
jgi:hypothetical protein